MKNALIGYTGFVGSNLQRQKNFTDLFNSSNIRDIRGQEFSEVYCAGAPARKWWANQHPDEDKHSIDALIEDLKNVRTEVFVLISTVDVYPQPVDVDEMTAIDLAQLTPYGQNRFRLEEFVIKNFPVALVIRLPGLFGEGLKKNIVYDFLHNNQLENINALSSFQFYNLNRLVEDIQTARDANLSLMNFATEPTTVQEVAKECFDQYFQNVNAPQVMYDIHTKYSQYFDQNGPYILPKKQVLSELKSFVQKESQVLGRQ